MVTKACDPDLQLPDIQPGYSKIARKNTVRFKDVPEESGSTSIGRQPPRKSLLPLAGQTNPFSDPLVEKKSCVTWEKH